MLNRKFTNFDIFLGINYIRRIESVYMNTNDFDSMKSNFENIFQENTKLKAEIEQLKAEFEQSVKLPERRMERKIEEHEFGMLGKGFDIGWNSCLDRIDLLKGQV